MSDWSVRRADLARFTLTDVEPGTRCDLWLDALPTPAGRLSLPLIVVRGARPGPTVMAVAGVHGDEFEGPAAIHDVAAALDPATMAGSFVGLPYCNPWAVEGLSRTTPPSVDGLNLARVFPGDPAGPPSLRLAHALLDLVRRNLGPADLFVDFHSSGTRYRYLPMIGYLNVGPVERSREAARRFGIDLLWELADQPAGRFNTEVARLGIPTLGTETNGQGGCRPQDAAEYAAGLHHMLHWLGVVPGPEPPVNDREPARFLNVLCPDSGLCRIRPGPELGERLSAGDLIARLHDPHGRELAAVTAPVAGRLVAIRAYAAVWAGDIAALIHPND